MKPLSPEHEKELRKLVRRWEEAAASNAEYIEAATRLGRFREASRLSGLSDAQNLHADELSALIDRLKGEADGE